MVDALWSRAIAVTIITTAHTDWVIILIEAEWALRITAFIVIRITRAAARRDALPKARQLTVSVCLAAYALRTSCAVPTNRCVRTAAFVGSWLTHLACAR